MSFEIELDRTFPQPPETVWRALTDPDALAAWLMENDFAAEEDRAFRMWCDDGEGGTDCYHCRVLSLEPPRRMLWSWALQGHAGAMEIEFRLEEVDGGTRLTVRHSGLRDRETAERFEGGWPIKLDQLGRALATGGSA